MLDIIVVQLRDDPTDEINDYEYYFKPYEKKKKKEGFITK